MQFITSLFGGSGNTYMTALFALGAVIVLIVLGVWLLKLVFRVSSNGVRGRNRRLAIVDSLVVDQKRQLLIVRRDNVEHLILTGGSQDRKAGNDAKPGTAPAATVAAGPGAAIDRAREANKARDQAPGRSLRHTGLLRPVPPQEPAATGYKPDISPVTEADSAKQSAEDLVNEGITRDQAQGESNRN